MKKNNVFVATGKTGNINVKDSQINQYPINVVEAIARHEKLKNNYTADDVVKLLYDKNNSVYTEDELTEFIHNPTTEFVINYLAPVLPMSIGEVNNFLNRVLKRSSLNYLDPDEYVLYFALKYNPGNASRYYVFCELKKLYEEATEIIEETTTTKSRKKNSRTHMLVEKAGISEIGDLDSKKSLISDDNIAALKTIFGKYKGLSKERARTLSKNFNKTLREICSSDVIATEISNEWGVEIGDTFKSYSLEEQWKEGVAVVNITNVTDSIITIPKNTIVKGKYSRYQLHEDVVLDPDHKKCLLEVYLDEIIGNAPTDQEFAPAGVELTVEKQFAKDFSSIHNIVPKEVELRYGHRKKHQFSKIRLNDHSAKEKKNKPDYSYIEVGTSLKTIPAGIKFIYQMDDGTKFIYVTKKEIDIPCSVEANLILQNNDELRYIDYSTHLVEEQGTKLKLPSNLENGIQITFLRDVKCDPSFDHIDMKEDNKQTMERFVRYLNVGNPDLDVDVFHMDELKKLLASVRSLNLLDHYHFNDFTYWEENEYWQFELLPYDVQRDLYLILVFFQYVLECSKKEIKFSYEIFDIFASPRLEKVGADVFRLTNPLDYLLAHVLSIYEEDNSADLGPIDAFRYLLNKA